MTATELRKKSAAQLEKDVIAWREKAAVMIRSRGVEEQTNVRELRTLRRDIARGLTVLGQKKREAAGGAETKTAGKEAA